MTEQQLTKTKHHISLPPVFRYENPDDVRKASKWHGDLYWIGTTEPHKCLGSLCEEPRGAWFSPPAIYINTARGTLSIPLPPGSIPPSDDLLCQLVKMHLAGESELEITRHVMAALTTQKLI